MQRVMSREPGAVYLDLLKARDAGERLVISPMDGVDLVLVPVRSEDHALPQETLLFVLESSGEYVIFGGGKDSVFGSIPDPERRGVWAFVPNEDRQLEVTLSRSLEEFGDDVAEDKPYEYDESSERFADPFADEAEMVAPDGVDEGWEKLSSVPDETWVYSNGERVIDRLGMPNESREARIVTSPGNTPVIDVAFMAAEYSPQAYELGEVAQIIINDVNLTMINTGIDTRFRLVGLDRNSRDFGVTSVDSKKLIDDMKGLIGQSDVHDFAYALRVNTGADIVVAITQLMGGAFGIAGGVPGPAGLEVQESVAIVRLDATGPGKLTGPHELAHLVGASHSSTSGETYAKDYAFLYYTEIYGTLMNPLVSYDYRIKFLSGPNVKFPPTLPPNQQVTAGNATHDNARAVDKWDDEVGDLKLGMYCKYFGVGHDEFAREMLASLTGKPGVTASDVQSYTTELSQAFRDQLVPYSARHAVIEMIESDEAGKIKELVRLYHMMLNRAPDYPGLEYWLGQRWSGLSINAVADAFATSPEFIVKHGSQADGAYV